MLDILFLSVFISCTFVVTSDNFLLIDGFYLKELQTEENWREIYLPSADLVPAWLQRSELGLLKAEIQERLLDHLCECQFTRPGLRSTSPGH